MKNSPKSNYSRNFKKQNRNDSDPKFHSKNASRSRRNNRSTINTFKNKEINNLNESDKKKENLSYTKTTVKLTLNIYLGLGKFIMILQIKKILKIGYGANIQFLRLLQMKDLLTEFGVLQKSFLQRNSIFYSKILN